MRLDQFLQYALCRGRVTDPHLGQGQAVALGVAGFCAPVIDYRLGIRAAPRVGTFGGQDAQSLARPVEHALAARRLRCELAGGHAPGQEQARLNGGGGGERWLFPLQSTAPGRAPRSVASRKPGESAGSRASGSRRRCCGWHGSCARRNRPCRRGCSRRWYRVWMPTRSASDFVGARVVDLPLRRQGLAADHCRLDGIAAGAVAVGIATVGLLRGDDHAQGGEQDRDLVFLARAPRRAARGAG